MRAPLGDAPILEDEDDVGVLYGRQAVGDGDRRAVLGRLVERLLDDALGLAVERRRRLVEQKDLRVADEGTGDGDALCVRGRREGQSLGEGGRRALETLDDDEGGRTLLAAREHGALAADVRVVAVREADDQVVDVGVLARLLDLLLRDLLGRDVGAERDVVPDRAGVERRLLRHERDRLAVRLDVELADVLAVDEDLAAERVVEPRDELDCRRLAAPTRADERAELAGLDLDVETAQDGDVRASRVPEVDILEADVALGGGEVERLARRVLGVDIGDRVLKGEEGAGGAEEGGGVGDL